MFTSLMYVSQSLLDRSAEMQGIEDIVTLSSRRNETLRVRGALVYTERHFAQVLEGPQAGVDELMASIHRDPRHRQVTICSVVDIDDYRFSTWNLAYHGGASYMDQHVSSLLRARDDGYDSDAARLYFLIRSFAIESLDNGPLGRPSRR